MKRTINFFHLAWLAALLTVPLTAAAQPHVGVWTSIDPNDGSRGYIAVNAAWQIVFFDSDATFGCREGGGGPFIGFDENNGNTVRLEGHVMVGHIDGACQNGGKNQNTSFDFGMGHFPEYDTIRSRGTDWDRTSHDPETFVANAFELEKLSAGAWEFFSGFSGGNPQIIPGIHCENAQNGLSIGNGSDLRACDLAAVTISGQSNNALLREAHMAHANIFNANFFLSDLSAADMHGATINFSYFEFSNLRYANLSGVTFQDTYFVNDVDLVGADLRYARSYLGGSFSTGHLDLRRANLTRVDFRNFCIYGSVDFRNANLTGAVFYCIDPSSVIFGNTICPDGSNSDDNGGTCNL